MEGPITFSSARAELVATKVETQIMAFTSVKVGLCYSSINGALPNDFSLHSWQT